MQRVFRAKRAIRSGMKRIKAGFFVSLEGKGAFRLSQTRFLDSKAKTRTLKALNTKLSKSFYSFISGMTISDFTELTYSLLFAKPANASVETQQVKIVSSLKNDCHRRIIVFKKVYS